PRGRWLRLSTPGAPPHGRPTSGGRCSPTPSRALGGRGRRPRTGQSPLAALSSIHAWGIAPPDEVGVNPRTARAKVLEDLLPLLPTLQQVRALPIVAALHAALRPEEGVVVLLPVVVAAPLGAADAPPPPRPAANEKQHPHLPVSARTARTLPPPSTPAELAGE